MDKNIAALLDTSAYTIKVLFKEAAKGSAATKYTYVCNIPGVKVGDWVIIDGPDYNNYTQDYNNLAAMQSIDDAINGGKLIFTGVPKVVLVVEVDAEVDIEPNGDIKLKWVVAKLDTASYVETMRRNSQIGGLVADAYKKSMRRSFADRILADLEGDNKTALLSLLNK